jgi:HEAT repeat protein
LLQTLIDLVTKDDDEDTRAAAAELLENLSDIGWIILINLFFFNNISSHTISLEPVRPLFLDILPNVINNLKIIKDEKLLHSLIKACSNLSLDGLFVCLFFHDHFLCSIFILFICSSSF